MGEILVTLLAKASLWANPQGSFQVLSTRLELCHPSPCCQHGPSPSGCEAELNHRPLPLPATREGTLTSQLLTHSHTHILSSNIVAHSHFHNPPSSSAPQPMVYFPAVHSHLVTTPPLILSLFLHPREGCQAAEKDFTHKYTPLCLWGFSGCPCLHHGVCRS